MSDAVNIEAAMTPGARLRRLGWSTDNRLVRAVGRVRLPLGAKLIAGFLVVGALLALVAALGLVALGQSNSRGEELRVLNRRAVYYQLVLTDATQLRRAIRTRLKSSGSTSRFGSGLDQSIVSDFDQLCIDTGISTACAGPPTSGGPPETLTRQLPRPLSTSVLNNLGTFEIIYGAASPVGFTSSGNQVLAVLRSANQFATHFATSLGRIARITQASSNALVAANRRAYSRSQTLLLGVAGGSLTLALALALVLSWSVVGPLRRTQERLSEIAGGDFSQHVVVPNRDEIGALAADVNRMNDELRRLYAELETASRHKSDFLATMSHELRTPLNAIIGFSEVLHEQMFGELNERQLAYVDDVLEAGKHLLSLINDVLDLAKIEAGRMELELSEVAIPELLRSAVSMHSERAARESLTVTLSAVPDEITVSADERRVRQVVFNLLSNAVKFTPQHGRIDVSARLDDGWVEVAVADTGPGIPAADQETIFEEFEQTTDGKKAEGTGLGLPLSRKLVELHGGRLWVDSERGKGSIFRFTLPVGQETAA
jgi:signal transduction histidine kinase